MVLKHFKRWVALAAAAAMLAACGGGAAKKPDWIMKGSGAFKADKKVFYGVGITEGVQSEALGRKAADNRAISEISTQLSTISTSLMRDYMSHASIPAAKQANEEQSIDNTIKTFTNNVVSGVKIVDRYYDEKRNVYYSLATLSLDELESMTEQMQSLSNEVRDSIKVNADKAFDKMAEEEEKHQTR
jgi:hypothetical protein